MNMDLIASVDAFPAPGQTLIGNSLATLPGGKGLNQAVAASRAGAHVAFYGCLGNDAFGRELRHFAAAEGIDVSHVGQSNTAATGTAIITVAQKCNGENHIVVIPGANHELMPVDLAPSLWRGTAADVLLLQFETPIPTVAAALAAAKATGTLTIVNASPAMPSAIEILRRADVVIVNEDELVAYALGSSAGGSIAELAKSAAGLCATPDQAWVVTLGKRGAMVVRSETEALIVPGFSVEAVDTTGAGDCFAGGLAARLADKCQWREALQYANAAAALSVTKPGAAPSMPLAAEVRGWLGSQPA